MPSRERRIRAEVVKELEAMVEEWDEWEERAWLGNPPHDPCRRCRQPVSRVLHSPGWSMCLHCQPLETLQFAAKSLAVAEERVAKRELAKAAA